MKIDPDDFIDKENRFYLAKSDAFIMFSLVELAGKDHFIKEDIFVYYYFNYRKKLREDRERMAMEKKKSKAALSFITPYLPLSSLDDEATKTRNFEIPKEVKEKYLETKELYPDLTSPKSESFDLSVWKFIIYTFNLSDLLF